MTSTIAVFLSNAESITGHSDCDLHWNAHKCRARRGHVLICDTCAGVDLRSADWVVMAAFGGGDQDERAGTISRALVANCRKAVSSNSTKVTLSTLVSPPLSLLATAPTATLEARSMG